MPPLLHSAGGVGGAIIVVIVIVTVVIVTFIAIITFIAVIVSICVSDDDNSVIEPGATAIILFDNTRRVELESTATSVESDSDRLLHNTSLHVIDSTIDLAIFLSEVFNLVNIVLASTLSS